MASQKELKRSVIVKRMSRYLITVLLVSFSLLLQAGSFPSKEECLFEMDYWSDFIALIVADRQASGTAFLDNQYWPATWPDDYLNIDTLQTMKLYFHPKASEERFSTYLSGRLPVSSNLVIKDYFFPYLVLYIRGQPTNTLRLYCYAAEDNDNIEYQRNRLEFTIESMSRETVRLRTERLLLPFNHWLGHSQYGWGSSY